MALGMVGLAASVWAGLLRLGWSLPPVTPSLAAAHGPLMVCGFLGTVIGLERAVALGRGWAYAAPLATGLGALALVVGLPDPTGPGLMTAGSGILLIVSGVILARQPTLFTLVMTLGACAWLVGQTLWLLAWPLYRVAPWWAGFLVLTIAGERLELARLTRLSSAAPVAFVAATGAFLGGLALTAIAFDAGTRVLGAATVALTLWLARHDVARRTVRQPGLTRFIALCLLSGYVWLGVSGLLAIVSGGVAAGPRYDATLHALFLGFVFSMIFGHAPVIFPAVLGWPVAFRPAFYGHLALLHLGLVARVAGDLLPSPQARGWGGALNAIALLLFFANTGHGVLKPPASPRARGS